MAAGAPHSSCGECAIGNDCLLRRAWQSSEVNGQTGQFLVATRQTIDDAFTRPRVSEHMHFHPRACALIQDFIWTRESSVDACSDEHQRLADELKVSVVRDYTDVHQTIVSSATLNAP
jgi:hypothetical protein